jgi:hypothetical protein
MAAQNKDINFVVLMAAPGIKTMQLMEEQNAIIMEQRGLEKNAIDEYLKLYRNVSTAAVNAKSEEQAKKDIVAILKKWQSVTDPKIVQMTTGLIKEKTEDMDNQIMDMFARQFANNWTRKFLSYDPAVYLQKTNAKVLALNGSKDMQVKAESNLEGIRQSLKRSDSPSFEVKELAGLNHLFQTCNKCTLPEYNDLSETFSPIALQTAKAWLDKEVK